MKYLVQKAKFGNWYNVDLLGEDGYIEEFKQFDTKQKAIDWGEKKTKITKNVEECRFLSNLCELHQSDKIDDFEFIELVKQFAGYSKAGNYLHEKIINRGIDVNNF